ncbi:MAG: thioesterase family protein [Bacillota bacterium]
MTEINPGLVGEAKIKVTEANTALKVGSGSVAVFATPMLVASMENAAINALKENLSEGQGSVGTRVDISHTAATPVGLEVTAYAKLVEADRKRLVFEVTAEDDNGPVGHGRHERFIVNLDKFMAKTKERNIS